jgi:lipid-binding SYLF domain-containing protein
MGLYGGISVAEAVVATRGALDTAYYAEDVSTRDILIRGMAGNPHGASRVEPIKKAAEAP